MAMAGVNGNANTTSAVQPPLLPGIDQKLGLSLRALTETMELQVIGTQLHFPARPIAAYQPRRLLNALEGAIARQSPLDRLDARRRVDHPRQQARLHHRLYPRSPVGNGQSRDLRASTHRAPILARRRSSKE